ncbi:MAG TPA: glycosyltransferase family 4 protein [Ktedonobacterales bacterium]|jgi:glycosyltransferase involved in cell wall biosynthesis
MIRVLYVADSLMAGGIESQLVELVTRLDRSRFDPHVLCLYGPKARNLHFASQIRAAGISLYTPDLGWSAWDKARGIASIIRVARAVRPQIIQAEGYHANLLMRLAFPFLPPVKLIGTVRGVLTAKQRLYERLGQRVCAHIVVNAPHLKTMLVSSAGVAAPKILSIPNGITLERYIQPHDEMFRCHVAPGSRRVFVSMGRISSEKNMHWIAQAFGILKRQSRLPSDVRCFIVGPVQGAAAQKALDAVILQDELGEVVIQHPETPYPEDYYHACDATILYSPAEGLPNVSIESLAAGRPVIISQAANAAGVIEDGVTGWVAPTNDVSSLADILHHVMMMSDAELVQMRQACLQRAQDYSVETLVQRYMTLYETWQPAALLSISPSNV